MRNFSLLDYETRNSIEISLKRLDRTHFTKSAYYAGSLLYNHLPSNLKNYNFTKYFQKNALFVVDIFISDYFR